ncbi:MAG: flavodoxin domain-containing protein [Oscillospiraceae bacterium]|nr:flavodoxin domain-containing protein [Oscillospiraceae bacterium]
MTAIVYESNTGFTERYAKILSEKTGVPVYPLNEAKKKIPKGEDIVFLGWVFANKIKGLDKAVKLWKISAVGAVGMNPRSDKNTEILREANKPECPLFYMWGGLDNSKLKGMNKFMLNLVRDSLEKENKPEYADAIKVFREGGDFVSEEYLQELVAFILMKM